jgi:hypothetical protein
MLTLYTNYALGSYQADRDDIVEQKENVALYNNPNATRMARRVGSCNHTFPCSACFKRRLTVVTWTPQWAAISANRTPIADRLCG